MSKPYYSQRAQCLRLSERFFIVFDFDDACSVAPSCTYNFYEQKGDCLPVIAFLFVTLRASDAAAQCIVIGPVCGFVFVSDGHF